MKTLRYITLTAIVPMLVASCNLDQFPESELAKEKASLNELAVGMYNSLHDLMYYEWVVTEVRSDNTRLRSTGSSTAESLTVRELDFYTTLSSNIYMQEYWDAAFRTVFCCNDVLENLDRANDDASRVRSEGEARFLRAHVYFNLVRLWGPMFLVDRVFEVEDYRTMQRSSVDRIYDFIESDLNAVIEGGLLPDQHASSDLGRVTMVAAKALMAKVCMTRYEAGGSQYLQAKTLLEEVLTAVDNPSVVSDLVAFDKIFAIDNEMNKEIIFAVRYMTGSVGLGAPFGNLFAPADSKDGVVINGSTSSLNYPTSDVIAAFNANAGDRRKNISLQEGFTDIKGDWITNDGGSRYVNKFMSKPDRGFDSENDWPVIRVGDVILLYAELLNETGNMTDALKYVNLIRERAGITLYNAADFASKYDLREAIKNERRLELAFENHRFFDLVRWGDAEKVLNPYFLAETTQGTASTGPRVFYPAGTSMEAWQTLLPIPLSVINVNAELTQNPGY